MRDKRGAGWHGLGLAGHGAPLAHGYGHGHGAALAGYHTGPNTLVGPSNGPNHLAGPQIGPSSLSGAVDHGAHVSGAITGPAVITASKAGPAHVEHHGDGHWDGGHGAHGEFCFFLSLFFFFLLLCNFWVVMVSVGLGNNFLNVVKIGCGLHYTLVYKIAPVFIFPKKKKKTNKHFRTSN